MLLTRHPASAAARTRRAARQPPRAALAAASPSLSSADVVAAFERQFAGLPVGRALASFQRVAAGAPPLATAGPLGAQEAHSYVDALLPAAAPFHDPAGPLFRGWAAPLAAGWHDVAAELAAAERPPDWRTAARAEAVAYGPEWRTLVLQDRGRWHDEHAAQFPATVALLKACAVPSVEAFFARQGPRSGIKTHTDDCNFILTAHLGLSGCSSATRITAGAQTRAWADGGVLVVDTSFQHGTVNEGDDVRSVLLLRFWHPGVTAAERVAHQWLFDVLDDGSPGGLAAAGRAADRALARLARPAAAGRGFGGGGGGGKGAAAAAAPAPAPAAARRAGGGRS